MMTWTFNQPGLLIGAFAPRDKHQSVTDAHSTVKVAAFDLDGTIIRPKSGRIRPVDSDDWELWDPIVPSKIQKAREEGFEIKIITNQGRLTDLEGNEAAEAETFKHMIERVLELLDVPLSIYVACANDNWRKPRDGVWLLLVREYQQKGKRIDPGQSFIVGDAAGRASDHTDADIHYSMNLGIGFRTPEEFFLGIQNEAPGHKFHPSWFLNDNNSWKDIALRIRHAPMQVLLLVGGPGSGKSCFFRNVLQPLGYSHICPNTLGSRKRGEEKFESSLAEKIPVVIDDHNCTVDTRRSWLSIADRHNAQVAAILFDLPINLCLHNDTARALGGRIMNPEGRGIFPRTPFLKVMAELERPSTSEGFVEVISLGFQWMGSEEELQIWQKFWI